MSTAPAPPEGARRKRAVMGKPYKIPFALRIARLKRRHAARWRDALRLGEPPPRSPRVTLMRAKKAGRK